MVNFFKKEKKFTPVEQTKLDRVKDLKLSLSMPTPNTEAS